VVFDERFKVAEHFLLGISVSHETDHHNDVVGKASGTFVNVVLPALVK
jgi:hypothetical protein